MTTFFNNRPHLSPLNAVLFTIYLGVFLFFVFQPPIFSPDTNTYFRLHFYRFPAYGIFLRTFDWFLGSAYAQAVVAFQLIFGLVSVHIFAKNVTQFLKIPPVVFVVLLAMLLMPFFPPLLVANNICSEGLSYPLYLLLLSFSFDFLFRNKQKRILPLAISFLLLCLTRGQFIIVAPILAVIFILKERRAIFKKPLFFYLFILLLLPLAVQTVDKTYHKLVHGFFVSTPFSYVNALTLPLYVSDKKDVAQMKDASEKELFLLTYKSLDSMGLLGNRVSGDYQAEYRVFHNNFPWICNRTFHRTGLQYFEPKAKKTAENVVMTERAAKNMMLPLIKANFREYIAIYFQGIFHGFKGIPIAILVLLLFLYSGFLTLKKWTVENGVLLLGLSLIVSNAMIVAFASHSIMRYLFYNYFFAILIALILFRKLILKK